jgi:predicted nucleotidyltransferase
VTPASFDHEAVRAAIEDAVAAEGTPAFYAVGGSHVYGWADADSDLDVRGFHVADARRYLLLDQPRDQVTAARDLDSRELDLVSYELRTFGSLVADGNFNVIECVCAGDRVLDRDPAEIDALESLVAAALPLDLPAAYAGMARTNYRDVDPDAPDAKTYLYAVRGLLAALYVHREHAIEADVHRLADAVLDDTAIVDGLVAAKRTGGGVDDALAARADDLLADLFERVEAVETGATDDATFRRGIDAWILDVRANLL